MTSIVETVAQAVSAWRDNVDTAAADLPGIGGLFARKWRILRYDSASLTYTNSEGEQVSIPSTENMPSPYAVIFGSRFMPCR